MKKLALIAFLILSTFTAYAKGGDTAYYRRPYYIGISGGYNVFTRGVMVQNVSLSQAYNDHNYSHISWSGTYGLQVAFPFARHWELEMALEGCFSKGWRSQITDVRVDPDMPWKVTSFDYELYHARSNSLTTRMQMGYEFFRRNNYAGVIGAELWFDVLGRQPLAVFNDGGYALVLKSYIPVSHGNAAIQVSALAGNIGTRVGMYTGLRVAMCLKGTRIYRHKPQHYYVRTYED